MFRGKIVIVGSGNVGATCAYTIMLGGVFSEIVIIDVNKNKAEGDAMDIAHGVSLVKPVRVVSGDYSECSDADIVVITAGVAQKPGETRLDLLKRNTVVFKSIISSIMKYAPGDVILLTVTNPVDILTYITWKLSGLPKNQVLGSGTVLDTSRLKYMLSRHTGIDARNCHTYIIGEHGDSEVLVWSAGDAGTVSLDKIAEELGRPFTPEIKAEIDDGVRNAAYKIIDGKGATFYGIAGALCRICSDISNNEYAILTVYSHQDDVEGVKCVCLSLPTVLGKRGVHQVITPSLNDEERKALHDSALTMKEYSDKAVAMISEQ